jgi:phosphate transport system permease protein
MRKQADLLFQLVSLATLVIALGALGALVYDICRDGASRLSWSFLTNIASRNADEAGVYHALMGSIWVIALTGLLALPIGVAAAIYLEEYGTRSRSRASSSSTSPTSPRCRRSFTACSARVVRAADGHGPERAGRRRDAGAAGAAGRDPLDTRGAAHGSELDSRRLVRPRRRRSGRPSGTRCCRWRCPGVLTGLILALSRAIGETAPLITIGALTYIPFAPDSVWSKFTVLPIQVFNWVSRPQAEFKTNAAAGILVLLALLLSMNAVAIVVRDRYQRQGRA